MRVQLWKCSSFLIILAGGVQAAFAANEEPLRRLDRAIQFPAACFDAANGPVSVSVAYELGRDRRARHIRIARSEHSCFDEAAIAATRSDFFIAVAGSEKLPMGAVFMHTITYIPNDLKKPSYTDVEAERVPPYYPQKCMRSAKSFELVISEFDISADGQTANVRAVDSTNRCLDEAANDTVRKWRYRLKTGSLSALERSGLRTETTFELTSGSGAPKLRKDFKKQVSAIEERIRRKDDPASILSDLDVLEKTCGGDFSRDEVGVFYRLRGAARVDAKDNLRARDDLSTSLLNGSTNTNYQAISSAVEQLSALVPELSGASAIASAPRLLTAPADGDH